MELTLEIARRNNYSILKSIIINGDLESLEYLISLGLTIDELRFDDNYALQYSSKYGYIEMVEYLMLNGLNINDIRSRHIYALRKALEYGNIEVVEFLIDQGLTKKDFDMVHKSIDMFNELMACHGINFYDFV